MWENGSKADWLEVETGRRSEGGSATRRIAEPSVDGAHAQQDEVVGVQHRQCQTRGGQVGARQGDALGHPARREPQLGVGRRRQAHVVAARGVQAGQRARRRGPGQELAQRGDLEQGVGAIGGDDPLNAQHVVVGQVRMDRHSRVQ